MERDYILQAQYVQGVSLAELMRQNVTGIVTAKDGLVVDFSKVELEKKIQKFVDPSKSDSQVRSEFFPRKKAGKYPPGDSRGWKLPTARQALQASHWRDDIQEISYRPLDIRAIIYRPDMVDWGRFDFMSHMLSGANFGFIAVSRQPNVTPPGYILATDALIVNGSIRSDSVSIDSLFPLYLYPDEQDLDQSIRVNFDPKLYAKIREAAGLTGKAAVPNSAMVESGAFRTATGDARPDEVKLFDYIYGVLHCPAYRETYAEFLKIDFPRVPFPPSPCLLYTSPSPRD